MQNAEDALLARLARVVRSLDRPPPVATAASVRAAEAVMGCTLPPLLARVYREVGNGGFGPAAFVGVEGGYQPFGVPLGSMYIGFRGLRSMKFLYQGRVEDRWPRHLLPVFSWPCCIYSCLDCTRPEAPVYTYDANCQDPERPHVPLPLSKHAESLQEWLELWLDGDDLWGHMMAAMRPDLLYIRGSYYADDQARYPVD